jgi:acetyl esterase/lipase
MIAKMIGLVGMLALSLPSPAPAQGKPLPAGTKVEKNLEYVKDGHERNRLDLYLPEKADGVLPVVVWIHGGAWKAGSKDNCPLVPMVPKGYAVASINYRFLQHADFPAQIEDCKAAIRWLRANAKKYNLDAKNIGVMGASAGGHLAALLGVAGDAKDLEGKGGNLDQSSRVQAVVDLFGPLGIPSKEGAKGKVLPYINKSAPPFLIVHGDADKLVPIQQAELIIAKLKDAGVTAELIVKKGAVHGWQGMEKDAATFADWFDRHLKKPTQKDK